jgi:predicted dehydrogenase/threonine dehydrogenase-like Zn-dependent dehydrogenase
MKQLLQNMRDGKTEIADVPVPQIRPGMALVRTVVSLVSAGTERMVVEFAEKSLVGKARSRPDLVRQLIDKAKREGILTTLESALNRLEQPIALGYSSAGIIVEIGKGLHGFMIGDRVACAGAGFAVHAEFALVPQNLLVPVPDSVDFDSAAFTTLGAIAMHGFRLAQPQLGERVAIIGLGLLGLLTAGIARAAGCQVFGIDLDPNRVSLAGEMGITAVLRSEAELTAGAYSHGMGFDAVLITADTKSDDPVNLAGQIARDRARVVAVGAVGLNIPRKIYYDKELSFHISRSYGPGRYDAEYEEKGRDYPAGYVRWTEGRNLAYFIDLLATKQIDIHPLITHRFTIDEAEKAYALITGKLDQPFLGVLLTYPQESSIQRKITYMPAIPVAPSSNQITVGVLGAGNYASAVFLPVIQKEGSTRLKTVVTSTGVNARNAARRFSFSCASSDEKDVLADPEINLVAILTRHNSHPRLVCAALEKGKHVYCEKPLAINAEGLLQVGNMLSKSGMPNLMVGFNRRFAPFSQRLQGFLRSRNEPLVAHYRVNAGYLPLNHWLHDPEIGGGRLIGEACHFIDYLVFLIGCLPTQVSANALPDQGRYRQDNLVMTFSFPDGSLGTVEYLANGDKSVPKERLEVFCSGKVAILDDFRILEFVYNGSRKTFPSYLRQDKGHKSAWSSFLNAIRQGTAAPIPYEHLLGVTQASIAAVTSLKEGKPVSI